MSGACSADSGLPEEILKKVARLNIPPSFGQLITEYLHLFH